MAEGIYGASIPDFIKLDGNWVSNATTDELSRIAVKSMIDCAHQLGADVIAEWVEDEPTRRLIAELGAEFVQGWLIHRPVPLDDLLALSAEDISK